MAPTLRRVPPGPTDKETERLYQAQQALDWHGRRFPTMKSIQVFVDEVLGGPTWQEWNPPTARVVVLDKRGVAALRAAEPRGVPRAVEPLGEAFYWAISGEPLAAIYLAPAGRYELVVLHELAHFISVGHGPLFARAFVELTSDVMGRDRGRALAATLRAGGVRLAPRSAITDAMAAERRLPVPLERGIVPEWHWGDVYDLAYRSARRERRFTYTDLCREVCEVAPLRPSMLTKLRRLKEPPADVQLRGLAVLSLVAMGYPLDELRDFLGLTSENSGLVERDGRLAPLVGPGQQAFRFHPASTQQAR